jgi:hypothetical protein
VTPAAALPLRLSVLQRAGAPMTVTGIMLPFGGVATDVGEGGAKVPFAPAMLALNEPLAW